MQTTSSASSLPPGGGRRWLEFYRASSEKWPRWKKIALCIGAIGAITIIALSATLAVNLRRGCEETTSTKGNTTSLITVTDTKVSTRTVTVTAIPRPDPNFLPACWGNLMSICSNNTQVPKDGILFEYERPLHEGSTAPDHDDDDRTSDCDADKGSDEVT
ncbi:hypothetical protein DL98DRAFT_536268 [Cadophora sp. DSE1049]|nr:hypothetical protein DL98DRAFT_536268 [Cadophora sp. DSE1049]